MNQINKLTAEIVELEDKAGQLDPKNYEELYGLLCKAYFNAKDIIELQNGVNPPVEVPTTNDNDLVIAELELKVKELTEANSTLENNVVEYTNTIIHLQSKLNQVLKIVT